MINYNVLKCSHEFKVKKVISFLSTCIFPDKTEYPINEEMLHNGPPHSSNDCYAYAKRLLEIHSKAYREQYNDNFIEYKLKISRFIFISKGFELIKMIKKK